MIRTKAKGIPFTLSPELVEGSKRDLGESNIPPFDKLSASGKFSLYAFHRD